MKNQGQQQNDQLKSGSPDSSEDEQSKLIMVIEDDTSILSAVADILELEGYQVVKATNGAEGLAALDRAQPVLILLDMRMPVVNGWQFAKAMQARGLSDIPVLVMTAAQDARQWSQEIGAAGYIAKPFHIMDLIDAVDGLLNAG